MAKVNLVDKKVAMTLEEVIKYQIITYCFTKKLTISDSDLECLTVLALVKKSELSNFCNACCDPENKEKDSTLPFSRLIFKTPQTVRNCLAKMANYQLVIKKGSGHSKTVEINSELQIQTEGNILLNYKIIYIESQKS